ncbi:MAG: hypothetical protein ACRETN_10915 [Nevskiales bacterium]
MSFIQRFHLGGFGFGPFELSRLVANTPIGEGLSFDERTCSPPQLTEFCVSNEAARRRFHCENFAACAENDAAAEHTWVRAFYLSTPTSAADRGTEVVFVSLDAVGAGNVILEDLKTAIRLSVPTLAPENILIGMTHSHAGADLQGLWGGVPQDWVQNILRQSAVNAVLQARNSAEKAEVTFATGKDGAFNNYRRPRYQEDTADADPQLSVLQAKVTGSPRVLGTLVQYSAHPTSIGPDSGGDAGRAPHPDYPLGLEDRVEEATGGAAAVYFNGPIADASPSGGPGGSDPYDSVRNRGDCLARSALAILQNNPAGVCSNQLRIERQLVLAPALQVRSADAQLPITNPLFLVVGAGLQFNRYYDFQPFALRDIPGIGPALAAEQGNLPQVVFVANTLVNRITLGSGSGNTAEIVTIPGETTNTFGQYIRQLAHDRAGTDNVMLFGLTQNSFGYILPEEEFNYIDPSGDAGFVLPGTGYEEFVSLGPLTAPLLRIQAYNPLFGVPTDDPANLPPTLTECAADPTDPDCIVQNLLARVDYIQRSFANLCRDNGAPAEFCALLDPQTPLAQPCRDAGLPEDVCDIFGDGAGGLPGDADLVLAALDAQFRGCDMLDTAHCLLPFPNDHFTVPAPAGSPQAADQGGSGRRVNLNVLAMPRNIAGKPIEPSEWNRNDGFSPGNMIISFVPGLAANPDGTIPGAVPLSDLALYTNANAPVMVLDATTGQRHPVWAEIDLNAGKLLPSNDVPSPKPAQAALIIRPAVNFAEGRRYVVVLRNLKNGGGANIPAGAAFTVCRDQADTLLPPLQQRCSALEQKVFPVLNQAGITRDAALYLAWDFTVASASNNTARLVHMRDDAFKNGLGDQEDANGNIIRYGRAPAFEVTDVIENPNGELARQIKGTFRIPSYVLPADPSPLDGQTAVKNALRQLAAQFPGEIDDILDQCGDVDPTGLICDFLDPSDGIDLAASASLPPNRLFYNPTDGLNPNDPLGSIYGDGLPDRNPSGDLTATFTCNIPKSALSGKSFADANLADIKPARPSLYGHGLLGSSSEVGAGNVRDMGNDHGMMYCATDWFGFATGDVPNVLAMLLDLSLFPAVPDGGQQGVLNFMFLARLMAHPNGFAADPAFQVASTPVFDRREVFYDGNSQGGILAGPVIAASKDVNRGVLGVIGMNYSTLLARSVDFDTYSIPLYLAYPDDLDRNLNFALIQMLWDRSENNGYAHHLTRDTLGGPDNQVLLHPAFADHQVTHWSAQVMARTLAVEVADLYPRKPGECGGDVRFCFNNKSEFFEARDPDIAAFWNLPLVGRDAGAAYDAAVCTGSNCRSSQSGFIEFDEGKTAIPPIGNVPPRADDFDPHGFPRSTKFGQCQKSHFLHTQGRLIDVRDTRSVTGPADCPALPAPVGSPLPGDGARVTSGYGSGLLGLLAELIADIQPAIASLLDGDVAAVVAALQGAVNDLLENLAALPALAGDPAQLLGLSSDLASVLQQAVAAERGVEPVVLTGAQIPAWSQPAAIGLPLDHLQAQGVRSAYAGLYLFPPNHDPETDAPSNIAGAPVAEIAAYKWDGAQFVEIPVQVDEKYAHFLANNASDFGIYSGADMELTYAWDSKNWNPGNDGSGCNADLGQGAPDPIAGLDNDDEIVFMASDAGGLAPPGETPPLATASHAVFLTDLLNPASQRAVYLVRQPGGTSFDGAHYVNYARNVNASQWIDRGFFTDNDPEKLGTSNTGYGPNLEGSVCNDGTPATLRLSNDRFTRDGTVVTTDTYRWEASGRWMIRDIRIKQPGVVAPDNAYWQTRPDLIDRWKGRAFQQSPDSTISVVGFEDEQVNWEANSILLGERCGPVRCMREVWGADSGTNVTKTETFYRNAVAYRYHVRVHPIPPDGLYTSWDYNRNAMVSDNPAVPAGRYFTLQRPQGVPVDGINDDIGQVDGFLPISGQCPSPDDGATGANNGSCPAFFDAADPTFNLTLAFNNWEQVSGKGDLGSLVYTFQNNGATSFGNPLVVPYYRDDACLDDGTGDDPVQRPFPGESYAWNGGLVPNAYNTAAGRALDHSGASFTDCIARQGAHAAHGIHYFVTHDSDNAFAGVPTTEIDGTQWQFMVPTAAPANIAEAYANVVRVPLLPVVVPLP